MIRWNRHARMHERAARPKRALARPCASVIKKRVRADNRDRADISTCYVERQNLAMRLADVGRRPVP